jgi:hypothetical protein
MSKEVPQPEEEYEYYSEEEQPPPKPEKKKHKPPKPEQGRIHVPAPEKPPPSRLSQTRRLQIIADKRQGLEDPEYEAVQNPRTGTWRVTKRKTLYSPAAKVEANSPPAPQHDILVTWMNMQQSENEGLKAEMRKLGKKYEKLATKYEERYRPEPVPVVRSAEPRKPSPEAPRPPAPVPHPGVAQRPRMGVYTRARRIDVRQF